MSTPEQKKNRIEMAWAFARNVAATLAAITALSVFVWYWIGPRVVEKVRDEIGIAAGEAQTAALIAAIRSEIGVLREENAASEAALQAAIAAVSAEQGFMRAEMDRQTQIITHLSGEDRVIRQEPGLSYVEEPVYIGDDVTMIMVAERTDSGRSCRLTEWAPLFTDETGIPVPGTPAIAGPVARQISDQQVKLKIEIVPPEGLRPGRIELYLVLFYDCGGQVRGDRTATVAFKLLERS